MLSAVVMLACLSGVPAPRATQDWQWEPAERPWVHRRPPRETDRPGPSGAFGLGAGRLGLSGELGFPYAALQVALGLGLGFEVGAGYRYPWATGHGGYGQLRWGTALDRRQRFGLGLAARAGAMYAHGEDDTVEKVRKRHGGDGWFAEVGLLLALHRYAYGFHLATGVRLAEIGHRHTWFDETTQTDLQVISYTEVGWEWRLTGWLSSLFALGVDVQTRSLWQYGLGSDRWTMVRVRWVVYFEVPLWSDAARSRGDRKTRPKQ